MKAAVKSGKERFEIREIDDPAIGPNDCLVRLSYCAICVWCYKEWQRDGSDDLYGPGLTGHEMSGVVAATGDRVTQWKVGDEVLTYFFGHCGTCDQCRAGKTMYCRAADKPQNVIRGYTEYVSAAEQCLLPLPAGTTLRNASIVPDMIGTPMHAIRRAFSVDLPRDVIAVWGLGPVGLFTVQGLRTFGDVKRIVAIDPIESRRDLAASFGADLVLDPNDDATEPAVQAENAGRGPNYAFNCALPRSEAAFRTLGLDGYLMNITGSVATVPQTEKRVDGSFYFNKDEHIENTRLIEDGRFCLDAVISHEFPLAEINAAMEIRAKHPDRSLKVLIRCA